mgnify:CR=1 FL=1
MPTDHDRTRDPIRLQRTTVASYDTLADDWFLELVHARRLRQAVGARWVTRASVDRLAAAAQARVSYAHDGSDELVLELDRAVAHVIARQRTVTARVASAARADADAALQRLRRELPPVGDDGLEVPLRLWWWQERWADDVARVVHVPAWAEIAGNYAADCAARLARLVAWRERPPGGGRLLLLHGPTGTGKSTAVRMLAGAWREWADVQLISDPEQFLAHPGYLMAVGGGDGPAHRWRVAVLEDAGELLAREQLDGRPALARLLNVCDGPLGDAMRMLVLVTTNRRPEALHPALVRPGRRLADVAFTPLSADEAARWCRARGVAPLPRRQATIAELYAHAEGRELPAPPPPVGFAIDR